MNTIKEIKISGKYAEYVKNLGKVEHILNQCEFDLIYKGLDEKRKQYKYILYINDLQFGYNEGIGNAKLNSENKQDKMLNAIWCLLTDRQCVNNSASEYDFLCEFGYNKDAETLKNGHRIFNYIQVNNAKLLKAFSGEQLDFLAYNIQL